MEVTHRRRKRTERKIREVTRKIKNQVNLEATEPGVSARRNGLGLKKSTFNNLTREDLNLRPYYLQECQDANSLDPEERLGFCRRQLANQEEDENYIYNISWSDEAGLTVNGKTL